MANQPVIMVTAVRDHFRSPPAQFLILPSGSPGGGSADLSQYRNPIHYWPHLFDKPLFLDCSPKVKQIFQSFNYKIALPLAATIYYSLLIHVVRNNAFQKHEFIVFTTKLK